jgi:hypothetical protein
MNDYSFIFFFLKFSSKEGEHINEKKQAEIYANY